MTVPDGIEAYYLAYDGVNKEWVQLTEITEKEIPAGVGVVLKAEQPGVYHFAITDKVSSAVSSLFKGSVVAEYIAAEAYVLSISDGKAELCKAEMNKSVGDSQTPAFLNNGHKAYLPVCSLAQSASLSASLRIHIPGVTAVDVVKVDNECAESVYDLTGRKVQSISQSGVYIVNGKKRIIRR